jgi:sterol 24-C-methyltransferase
MLPPNPFHYMLTHCCRIDRARHYTAKKDLSSSVTFVKGDFMKMPFADNTFDRIYSIEATCHAPSLTGVYSEIFRVLKPGGTYATYEWLLADHYDASNPSHRQISYDIEIGDGIPAMVKKSVALKAFEEVGFEVIHDEDLADKDDYIPWYYPLAGELWHVRSLGDLLKVSLMTRPARYISHGLLGVLGFLRLAPPDAMKTADALGVAADALVAGGRDKLFTPMQLYVARKPE